MKLIRVLGILLLLLGNASGGMAAEADLPDVALPLPASEYLVSGKPLLTGIRLEPSCDLVLEPHLSLGHARREREVRSGYDEITHTIHARAGGSISLFQTVAFSAAAKLPVYSVESSDRWVAGAAFSQPGSRRYGYDILHPENVCWTGEMGIHLGERLDFSLYYDQNRYFDNAAGAGGSSRQEDRFGTRLIFRFK